MCANGYVTSDSTYPYGEYSVYTWYSEIYTHSYGFFTGYSSLKTTSDFISQISATYSRNVKMTGQVRNILWCSNNWKLLKNPDSTCNLSSDNKIASCPTSIGNSYLCVP